MKNNRVCDCDAAPYDSYDSFHAYMCRIVHSYTRISINGHRWTDSERNKNKIIVFIFLHTDFRRYHYRSASSGAKAFGARIDTDEYGNGIHLIARCIHKVYFTGCRPLLASYAIHLSRFAFAHLFHFFYTFLLPFNNIKIMIGSQRSGKRALVERWTLNVSNKLIFENMRSLIFLRIPNMESTKQKKQKTESNPYPNAPNDIQPLWLCGTYCVLCANEFSSRAPKLYSQLFHFGFILAFARNCTIHTHTHTTENPFYLRTLI